MLISGINPTSRMTQSPPSTDGGGKPAVAPNAGDGGETTRRNFISPYMVYDQAAQIVVLQVRDVQTGDIQMQFPAKRVVEDYRRQMEATRSQQKTELLGQPSETEQDAGATEAAAQDDRGGGAAPAAADADHQPAAPATTAPASPPVKITV